MSFLAKREPYACTEKLGDLTSSTSVHQFKKETVYCRYPLKLGNREKERDKEVLLGYPPEIDYQVTPNRFREELESKEVKDLKAEVKRIYEIENCKISEIAEKDEEQKEKKEETLVEKEAQGKNIYDRGSGILQNVSISDIKNNQIY